MAAASKLGEVHLLLPGPAAVAGQAAKLPGVAKVLHAEAELYAHGLAEPLAALLLGLAPQYSHLLAPASAAGKNVMPALVDAASDRCTLGEMVQAMADIYGRYSGGPEW